VLVVVDSGLHRIDTYDPESRASSLDTVWIAQSNAIQRKGRAGRVRKGEVYRLYSKAQFDDLPWRSNPEMQRTDVAGICLQTMALNRCPQTFLGSAPDPPPQETVEVAMMELASIGAIQESPLEMLPLGKLLSNLPLHPLQGRALVLSTLFGAPRMMASMMAVSGGKSVFKPPDRSESRGDFQKLQKLQQEIKDWKRQFCSWSDVVADARALVEYEKQVREWGLDWATEWARANYLDPFVLSNRSRVKHQLIEEAHQAGVVGIKSWEWDDVAGGRNPEAGGIFEAHKDLSTSSGLSHREWMSEVSDRGEQDEVVSEAVLGALLCAANPPNMATVTLSGTGKKRKLKCLTRTDSKVQIDMQSVNDKWSLDNQDPWLVYGSIRKFRDRATIGDTSVLNPWQVALFGGLTVDKPEEADQPVLDGWIELAPEDDDMKVALELAMTLRAEVEDGVTWAAIAALDRNASNIARAARARSSAVCHILGAALAGRKMPSQEVEFLRGWRMLSSGRKQPLGLNERQELLKKALIKKSVSEIKEELQSMGLSTNGSNKGVLIERATLSLSQKMPPNIPRDPPSDFESRSAPRRQPAVYS